MRLNENSRWKLHSLNEICVKITDGSHFSPQVQINGMFPIATVANIKKGKIDISSCKKISKKDYMNLVKNGCKPDKGDVLFSKDGTVGISFVYNQNVKVVLLSSIAIIQPQKNLNSNYLGYVLNSPLVAIQILRRKRGTGLRRIILKDIELIKIPLPPIPEQNKIAEILTTVDEAIEKVDGAIRKAERLKKGLMQTLLTRGIGHKEFQDTKIGRIPREWKVCKLDDIANLERGKFSHRPRNDPRFYVGEYPFIQTGDIREAEGLITKYSQTLNSEGIKLSKYFKKGTIVISIAGNIGDVGILDFGSYFPDSIIGITPYYRIIIGTFLLNVLKRSKNELDSMAPRSTQKNINLAILVKLKLPLPPLLEQKKIAEILSTADQKLELMRESKSKLNRVKKGLMNDLLSGKRRVKL